VSITNRLLSFTRVLDDVNEWSGRIFSWLIIPATIIVVAEVTIRKAFNASLVWGYDMSMFLTGFFFMLGMGYTLSYDAHVRVDFISSHYKPKTKAFIELVIYLLFIIPMLIVFFKYGFDYAYQSWVVREKIGITVWDPVVYPFKTAIPVAYLLLLIQCVSHVIKHLLFITKGIES